jgi:uncharacterized membrane protein YhhN
MNTSLIIAVSLLSIAALLVVEVSGRHRWRWLFKPLAASCFIALALQAGALHSDYGRWLLAGLVLCWFGDVLLIPKQDKTFLAGLTSFLLGHLLFAVGFAQLAINHWAVLMTVIPVAALIVLTLRWLWPRLNNDMRLPVVAYMVVIGGMLLSASATWGSSASALIIVGAWGFAVSDLAVARDQFVAPGYKNRLWGLPLYFGSQMLLAWSPALAGNL